MGDCPVCGDNLSASRIHKSRQPVIRIVCPLDFRHFELLIRDAITVREYAKLCEVSAADPA